MLERSRGVIFRLLATCSTRAAARAGSFRFFSMAAGPSSQRWSNDSILRQTQVSARATATVQERPWSGRHAERVRGWEDWRRGQGRSWSRPASFLGRGRSVAQHDGGEKGGKVQLEQRWAPQPELRRLWRIRGGSASGSEWLRGTHLRNDLQTRRLIGLGKAE